MCNVRTEIENSLDALKTRKLSDKLFLNNLSYWSKSLSKCFSIPLSLLSTKDTRVYILLRNEFTLRLISAVHKTMAGYLFIASPPF